MQQTEFSDSFIKGMLGWIRWIASSIANMFQTGTGNSTGSMSSIAWFADNWIKILIGLIIVGVVVDWVVWMARWRPYWVWFRKRRILLDNNVDGIDDDDLMLHYGDMARTRARRSRAEDEYDPELDEFDDIGGDPYDEFDEENDEEEANGEDEEDDGRYDSRAEYRDRDSDDLDALYNDRYGDYARRDRDAPSDDEPEDEDGEGEEPEAAGDAVEPEAGAARRPFRVPAKRKNLFARPRKKPAEEEDPFSVEGDFFDDLGEDPMGDIASPRAKARPERLSQDTSVYQRPRLLPGDEPGAVRGADEADGWHSGYTQRSVERGKRRKRDARA